MLGLVAGLGRGTASLPAAAVSAGVGAGHAVLTPVVAPDGSWLRKRRNWADGASESPRVVWAAGARLHVEVAPLPDHAESRRAIEAAAAGVLGIVSAHVEPVLGRLVIQVERDQEVAEAADQVLAMPRNLIGARQNPRAPDGPGHRSDGAVPAWAPFPK